MEFLIDQASQLKQEYYVLDGLPTDVLKVENLSSQTEIAKNIILIIPGNPGIVRYYSTFIKELHKEIGGSKQVWAVSHFCHTVNNFGKDDFQNSNPLDLEIEHKLRFLEQKVPRKCRITLVGHSIGCYMILAILEILSGQRRRPRIYSSNSAFNHPLPSDDEYSQLLSRIDKCYLLFPTIERMRVSPNGRRLWPLLNYLQRVIVGLVSLVSWLPQGLRTKIASMALSVKCSDAAIIESTVDLITPRMFGNMLQLAYNELSNVDILNIDSIDTHKDRLVFYYGTTDGWCPLSYRNDLVKLVPDLQNYIDCQNIGHAFVVSHSRTMASVLAGILNRD